MTFDLAFDDSSFDTMFAAATLPARAATEPTLVRHGVLSPQRVALEKYVQDQFRAHFGARIRHLMPELLALHGKDGCIRAVVGCRAAAAERLFLETYTREPIEAALAARLGVHVARERIVEIGSLACNSATAAIAIIRALVPHLLRAGFAWVVFTGADTVLNVFRHLGLAPRELCVADPRRLGDARHDWGSYYDHAPRVMAGRIQDGARETPRAARRPQ